MDENLCRKFEDVCSNFGNVGIIVVYDSLKCGDCNCDARRDRMNGRH